MRGTGAGRVVCRVGFEGIAGLGAGVGWVFVGVIGVILGGSHGEIDEVGGGFAGG